MFKGCLAKSTQNEATQSGRAQNAWEKRSEHQAHNPKYRVDITIEYHRDLIYQGSVGATANRSSYPLTCKGGNGG